MLTSRKTPNYFLSENEPNAKGSCLKYKYDTIIWCAWLLQTHTAQAALTLWQWDFYKCHCDSETFTSGIDIVTVRPLQVALTLWQWDL